MQEKKRNQSGLSVPPKRFHPKGMNILHEDRDIIVVDKVSGLLTMANESVRTRTAYYLLNDYVRRGNVKSRNRVFIVHRLDRDTSGVLVFAKNEGAKRFLQDEWQTFTKKYIAIVHGRPSEDEGQVTSYLAENSIHRVYSTSDPKRGKEARTGYRLLQEASKFSMLEITLFTGRKNQIRVHLADLGNPVAGDKIYGEKGHGVRRLMLHSASLAIRHPHTKQEMHFEVELPIEFPSLMKTK